MIEIILTYLLSWLIIIIWHKEKKKLKHIPLFELGFPYPLLHFIIKLLYFQKGLCEWNIIFNKFKKDFVKKKTLNILYEYWIG